MATHREHDPGAESHAKGELRAPRPQGDAARPRDDPEGKGGTDGGDDLERSSVRTNRTEDDIGEYANALNGKDEEGGTQIASPKPLVGSGDTEFNRPRGEIACSLFECGPGHAQITGHV